MNEETNEQYKMTDENFRLFYQNQYDRIDKLETKRENLCNYVLTVSTAIIGFYLSTKNHSIPYTNLLVVFVCAVNLIAIVFIRKTRPFIKMHQKRASLASKSNANEFNRIKKHVGKVDSDEDFFNRNRLYIYLHILIILTMIIFSAMINKWCFCQ
ncbi:hypothetical protein [Fluviicola sp.]|uniref:hypothetical protein n=1 Tax=Fluviicola sp. TaxID=1917219 RepID=UPI0031D59AFC